MSEDVYTHEMVGKAVKFTDTKGVQHDALVTCDFSTKTYSPGSVNVTYVSSDSDKSDPYGRQIERASSIPHKSNQSAHGNFWE